MSEVILATRYAASNYPLALENLAKRYRRAEGKEPVHYSEIGFGGLSEDQANSALGFFGDIELLQTPKSGNYIPPESVMNWQLKMGESAKKGKQEVFDAIQEYNVFDEIVFVLLEEEKHFPELAEQVGGMVGIDEDELGGMKKTIEVFIECGFLEVDEEEMVSIADDVRDSEDPEEEVEEVQTRENTVTSEGETVTEANGGVRSSQQAQHHTVSPSSKTLSADLEITMDATKMEHDDLKKKLEVIEEIVGDDGE